MANPAQIDDGVVLRLLAARLETITGVAIRHLGEDESEGNRYTARVAAMTIEPMPRNAGDDYQDAATLEVTVVAACDAAATAISNAAIAALAARVAKALDGQVLRDVSTTHQVQLGRVKREIQTDPDPDRQLRTAVLTVTGHVQRFSGDTLDASLLP